MRFLYLLLIVSGVIACKKTSGEINNIQKYYAGQWKVDINDFRMDTSFVLQVDAEGKFYYILNASGVTSELTGAVDNEGVVDGTIEVSNNKVGIVKGNFYPSLSGKGYFHTTILDTIKWTAARQ